jgi:hypothetical protein
MWWLRDEVRTVQVNEESYGPGVRYVFSHWSDGGHPTHAVQAVGPLTLTAYADTQYRVRLQTSPLGLAVSVDGKALPTVFDGWWPAGSVHNLSAPANGSTAPGALMEWRRWSDGEVAVARTVGPLEGPLTLVAEFDVWYLLTVEAFGQGPFCDRPACWYPAGSVAVATIPELWEVSAGTRERHTGWADGAGGSNGTREVVMDGPQRLEPTYQREYEVRVRSDHGVVEGAGWYAAGSRVDLRVAQTFVQDDSGAWLFAGWWGAQGGSDPQVSLLVDGPKELEARWEPTGTGGVLPTDQGSWIAGALVATAAAALVLWAVARRRRSGREGD